ncbi:uncharacterized protein N7511_006232 [Penicillium nucicola]|uniref:uncharacterized protein n=1 Tax=Penicillium nucicola TaxID=1850975 RepID=UPI002545821B|nr:uncharacterized protein N7511_006232 [Penicillium nucicola]KAJ5757538.1 hypothetical protein N7511_006232 [Penicillium nucicola]
MPAEATPCRKRWINTGDPMTNITDVPEGWSSHELDLHKDDVNSQIARCHERISDAIMPGIFRHRLAHYEQRRRYEYSRRQQRHAWLTPKSEMIASERADLPWATVQRLWFLKQMKHSLELNSDHDGQLPNVKGLIEAYRTGKKFEKGKLSY